jgi:uncharacterized membrane protein
MTREAAVWRTLADAGIVSGEMPPSDARTAWYVRALLGFGGWLAAGFLIAFAFAAFAFVVASPAAAVVLGLGMIAGAAKALSARPGSPFIVQMGLATSFAGQALFIFGIAETIDRPTAAAFVVAIFEAALAVLVRHTVHRFCCAAGAGLALAIALTLAGAHYLSVGLLAGMVATAWLNEFAWATSASTVRPIAHGITLALVLVQGTWFMQLQPYQLARFGTFEWFPRWLGSALPAIVLIAVAVRLLRRGQRPLGDRDAIVTIGVTVAIGAASFAAPGVAAAMMVLLLGFANGNRILMAIGVAALLSYVSAYYYQLETTLLVKSVALGVTGFTLLLARWTLARWFLTDPEVEVSGT